MVESVCRLSSSSATDTMPVPMTTAPEAGGIESSVAVHRRVPPRGGERHHRLRNGAPRVDHRAAG
jgi:hypothetical protein